MAQGILEDSTPEEQPLEETQEAGQETINQVKAAYPLLLNIMGDDRVLEGLVSDAQQGDPAEVLAVVVAEIVSTIKGQIPELTPDVMAAIGILAIKELADLFTQMGMEVTPEMQEQATRAAVQIYLSGADEATQAQIVETFRGEL